MAGRSAAALGLVVLVLIATTGCGGTPGALAPSNPAPASPTAALPFACGPLDLPTGQSPSPASASAPVTATARLGTLTASFTGVPSPSAAYLRGITSPLLSIVDGTTPLLSSSITPPDHAQGPNGETLPGSIAVTPTATPDQGYEICLARFAGQARPAVLLGFYSGGAHCCWTVRAYAVSATAVGPPVDIDLGDPAATLRAEGDHSLLVTADDAFAYQFDSYAGSGMPIKVLEFTNGAFDDTTRSHLDLVRADAARWWGVANDPPSLDGLGVLAPWVADECLLGQASRAFSTIDQLQAQGKLKGAGQGFDSSTGATYPEALRTFLTKNHYCSP